MTLKDASFSPRSEQWLSKQALAGLEAGKRKRYSPRPRCQYVPHQKSWGICVDIRGAKKRIRHKLGERGRAALKRTTAIDEREERIEDVVNTRKCSRRHLPGVLLSKQPHRHRRYSGALLWPEMPWASHALDTCREFAGDFSGVGYPRSKSLPDSPYTRATGPSHDVVP